MKNFKKMMALVIAMVMVLAMALPAMAAGEATTDGSITIKSPVMGASYTGYRVFDLTMNEAGDSFSYTIDNTNPFYNVVKAYAEEVDSTAADPTAPINGLKLTKVTTITDKEVYNVSVENNFDAQKFGQTLEAAIPGLKTTAATELAERTKTPTYESGMTVVTAQTAAEIKFEDLPLGYYLIIGGYPDYSNTGTLTYYKTRDDGTTPKETDADAETYKVEVSIDLQKEVTEGGETQKVDKTREELEAEATTAATQAVTDIVTDAYVDAYIAANPDKFPGYAELPTDEKAAAKASAKKLLEDSTKESVIHQYLEAVNQLQAHNSDINVQTQRLVFIDSTTPNAEIIEKNELDKWDVPVNPDNSAEYVPHEYGEPDGGKNIVVGYTNDNKPIYADWTEANVGDSIHYQLRVNAMNFIRTDDENLANEDALENKGDVKQVKEYILADSHKDGLKFDPSTNKGADGKDTIKVSIVDGDNNVIKLGGVDQSWDYTAWHELFFDDEALLSNGGGIAIPWVIVTEDKTVADNYKNVTTNTVLVWKDAEKTQPDWVDENADPKVQKTKEVYICSKYDSDVTIVVDYTMTLTDKAVIDNPGNINTSQYGMNYVKPEDEKYQQPNPDNPPSETPKPDQESEKDTATVFTYALALQKVDENENKLAGATFAVKGLTVSDSAMSDGFYKVGKYDPKSDTYSVELKADKDGLLVLEGFSSSEEITIKEIKAPDGYNLVTEPIVIKPTKTGAEVVTTGSTTYYDKDKNAEGAVVTGKVDSKTHEKIYYKNGNRVAKIVVEDGVTKWFGATDEDTLSETGFNTAIEGIVTSIENGTDAKVATLAALETAAYKVINRKGTELPSTGGIGTTIFYVIGAILVLGAGILLVTRRRMNAN